MRVLCVLGEHQYGDPSRGNGPAFEAFVPAMRRLGHDVIHFESRNRARFRDFGELNRALLETIENLRPDVMFAVQLDYEIWLETLEMIRRRGDVTTICWMTDDSWKFGQFSRFVAPAYDAVATTFPEAVGWYRRIGYDNAFLTQWAASADRLREPLTSADCRYAVSFVGAVQANRLQLIERLRSAGIEVECFGHGWPNGSVEYSQMTRIMQESLISLGFTRSKGANQIKARTFEVPGSGGFLLAEHAEGLDAFFEIGREIETFRGDDEMVDKIRYYLAHPEQRDAVARAGYERVVAEHTYDHRVSRLLEFALQTKRREPGYRSRSFAMVEAQHTRSWTIRSARALLVGLGRLVFGPRRGVRAARRLAFELSVRLAGARTFSARGWPGRMFPDL